MNQELSSLPASRAEALRIGAETYFTGKPCKRGNIAERSSKYKICLCDECREARRQVQRNHYKKNSDKVRQKVADYRARNKDLVADAFRRYYQENSEHRREMARDWYRRNKERSLSSGRNWYLKNKGVFSKIQSKYRASNRHTICAISALRRAEKRNRIPLWFGEFDRFVIIEAAKLALLRKSATGISWHSDHMIPLMAENASGLHCAVNIQVIPAALNTSKQNKMILTEPGQWIKAL